MKTKLFVLLLAFGIMICSSTTVLAEEVNTSEEDVVTLQPLSGGRPPVVE